MTPPICECHGQPKRWHPDKRKKKGGWWSCWQRELETHRQRYAANPTKKREQSARRFKERYENDPVWRIERNLKRAREKRADTRARRRQQLEELRGEI